MEYMRTGIPATLQLHCKNRYFVDGPGWSYQKRLVKLTNSQIMCNSIAVGERDFQKLVVKLLLFWETV